MFRYCWLNLIVISSINLMLQYMHEKMKMAGDMGWNDFWRNSNPNFDIGYYHHPMRLGQRGHFAFSDFVVFH